MARKLALPTKKLYDASPGDGRPHVEFVGDCYDFVIWERGHEFERRTTSDPDLVLYWYVQQAIANVIGTRINSGEISPGIEEWRLRLKLFGMVSDKWARWERKEIETSVPIHMPEHLAELKML